MHVSSEPNTKARVNLNVDLINNTVSYLKVEQLVHVLHNRFVQFQKRINAPVGGPLPSAMGEIQPSSSLVVTGSASAHASPPSRAAICDSIVAKPPRERNYWDERELYVAAEELCCYLNGGVNYRILCAQYQDTLEAVRGMIQEDLQLSPSVEVVPTGTLERLMAQFEKAMRLCVRNFEEHGLPVPNALTELLAQHAGKPSSTPGDGKSSEAVDDASGGKASPSGIQTTQNSGQHFTNTTASANTSNIAFLDISSPRSPEGDRSIKKTPSGRSLSASSRSGLNFVEAGYPDERRSPNQNQLLSSRLSRARGPNDVLAHLPRQPQTNFVDDNASNRQRVYNRAASRHATNTSRSDCLSPTAHTPLSGELPNDAASPLMRSKVSSEGSGTYGGKPLRGNESAALRMGLPLPNTPPKRELSPPMSNNVSVERTKPQADLFLPSATDASMDVTLPPSVAFPNGPQPRRQRQLEELYNEAYHEDGQRFLLDALHIVYAYNYQASKGSFPSFRSQVQSDLRSALASREHFEETVGVPQLRSEYLIECLARMVKPHPQVLELLQSLDMQRGHARCEGGLSGIDVEALSLSGLQLGDSGAAALITLFPRLCRLTSVDLSDNNLHDGAVIRVLCATLRCHPSISRVVLSNNNVSEASVLELRRLVQSCRRRCTIELHGCPMPLALKQAINGKLS